MNKNSEPDKSQSNAIYPATLAMMALANTTGIGAINTGFSPVIPPAIMLNDDKDTRDLTE